MEKSSVDANMNVAFQGAIPVMKCIAGNIRARTRRGFLQYPSAIF